MRLTVETGPLAGTSVPLDRDAPTLIGCGDESSVRIQEPGVLEQHATVKALKGQGFGIKAHGPVRVNGAEVQASKLTDGDVIEIGTTRIAYGEVQDDRMPTIPGYRILGVLGQGGMGTVYRAEQTSLNRQVALKVLNRAQTKNAAFVAQFVAEARAAAKLQHPNVVSVFDVEHDGDLYYYAMELMHDGSCEDWLKQQGTMPVDRAMQVIADAAAGLAYAESLGIVHRDIKPDNLMLDQHGAVKIADLGLASTSSEQQSERAVGTPHFMAPEQVLKQPLDHRTDLYALGCTFYRLVTGRTPFRGQTVKDILRAQVKESAEAASKVNPDVPPEVSNIIQRLMEKDAGDRYQTANALLEELETLLQPPQKRGLWIGLAAAAVVVAGGAIYWAVTKPKEKEVVVEKYDDPLTQQFADRIKVLESEAAQKDATIALLKVQVSDADGEARAAAFDAVAAAHPDTAAAAEAARRAGDVRSAIAEQQRRQAERASRVDQHIASLKAATTKPLAAHDYERAMRALDAAPPDGIDSDARIEAETEKLRDFVLTQARARLTALVAPVRDARTANDQAALAAAVAALRQGLAPAARWPEGVGEQLASAENEAAAADAAIAAIQSQRKQDVWQRYDAILAGLGDPILALNFTAANAALAEFAADPSHADAGARAQAVRSWASEAAAFLEPLAARCSSGELILQLGEEELRIVGWNRAEQTFDAKTTARRPKARTIEQGALFIEHWSALAAEVSDAPPGSRECFLAFVVLDAHARAAQTYLARIDKGNDDSGTGDDSYPFAAVAFESLLDSLPQTEQPWGPLLRDELLAGKRLASGLRALSERRNLAAAGHIEKLLKEHPHSVVATRLP
ncbi:MAG: FHA domain-containing serine/threonine-protein kinase [Planctomycetota bacterium]|nr:FHA domain-containing serine/threonine-protein kinase [Planctomycetota bacterium]